MKQKKTVRFILYVLSALILIVGVPIAINELYKKNTGYITMWGAADVLGYYGTILGAIVTVGALMATIQFTKKQIQRERYLKNEDEKWNRAFQLFSNTIDKNNPMRAFAITVDLGDGTIQKCIVGLQQYSVEAKVSFDNAKANLDPNDYKKVEPLISALESLNHEVQKVLDQLYDNYSQLNQAIQVGEDWQSILNSSAIYRIELTRLHKDQYQQILNLRRDIFSEINLETERNADKILRLWRKKNADA